MAKQSINKTNAARLLDKAKIAYELIPYEVDAHRVLDPLMWMLSRENIIPTV